jgi:hypothetical protein
MTGIAAGLFAYPGRGLGARVESAAALRAASRWAMQPDAAPAAREGLVEFESSDAKLVEGFRWAKAQALAYVRNGDPIGPWYEAALPGRDAFCMRDTSHMSTGAQFLGLGARTRNMMRQFAQHISASKRWCTWWEITKDGKPAPVDYNNDHDFWYDLPANFDVLDACYRQWLWTSDAGYLDEVFLDFYRHTVSDFVREWGHDHDGLPEHPGGAGHMGIGTYDEDLQDDVAVGADLVAAEYAAYRGYAAFERFRGETAIAADYDAKAARLKSLYNNKWWDASRNRYYAAIGEDGKFHAGLKESTGRSDTELPLYYGLTGADFKTRACLDAMENRLKLDAGTLHGIVGGVEGRTYLPDIFYKYGRSQSGYAALVALMDPALKRREYPEVSFTVIGNLGSGLMGIQPAAGREMIETFPQLTPATAWAAIHHVPVRGNVICVRHSGRDTSTLLNESGPELIWRACFPESRKGLVVDSETTAALTGVRPSGVPETLVTVHVKPGESRTVTLQAG